jgi:hypothetical protein
MQVALVWSIRNMILASIARRFAVSIRLQYEAFVRYPRLVMEQLTTRLGLHGHDELWLSDNEVLVSASNHIFAGNPNRVLHGPIQIRPDDEWRRNMPVRQQQLVFALSLPALWVLGYLGTHTARAEAAEPAPLVGDQVG